MTQQLLNAYVVKADDLKIRIKVLSQQSEKDILGLGFSFDEPLSEYILAVTDNDQKAKIFALLRDMNICFSAGREWSPAEVFEYLRESGKLSGSYKRISWYAPNDFRVVEA